MKRDLEICKTCSWQLPCMAVGEQRVILVKCLQCGKTLSTEILTEPTSCLERSVGIYCYVCMRYTTPIYGKGSIQKRRKIRGEE